MKRLFLTNLFGLVLVSSLIAGQYGNLTYEVNGETVEITNCVQSTSGELVIPEFIEAKPVTSIKEHAFQFCTNLNGIIVPDSVIDIGRFAFADCSSLDSITLPSDLSTIPAHCFNRCSNLISLEIPNGVVEIGEYAFSNCLSLTSVILPSDLNSIGIGAFYRCYGLDSITLPYSLTTIGDGAFGLCSNLVSITIPSNVSYIGYSAFHFCSNMTSFNVDLANPSYSSDDGVLLNKLQTTLIQCPASKSGPYLIPSNVLTIAEYAFYECSSITDVGIPNGVSTIGFSAFGDCNGLTSIDIPGSVIYIDGNNFRSCEALTSIEVDLSNTAYSSVDGVLFNKSQTKLIQCPSGKVGTYAIPESVTSLGWWAFDSCSGITRVMIPASVTSIGITPFLRCDSLTGIDVDSTNPSFSSIEGVLFDKLQTMLVEYPGGLTGTYLIPDGVTSIGRTAFSYCSGLTGISIPESVTSIGLGAFGNCTALSSVIIPASVNEIRDGAFKDCINLESVVFEGNAPSSYITEIYSNTSSTFTIYYYEGATGFSTPTWRGEFCIELQLNGNIDGDSLPNNLERLLGTNPLDGNSALAVWLSRGSGGFKLHYGPHSADCSFFVEWTDDLSNSESWEEVAGIDFIGNLEEQIAELPETTTGANFFRVHITANE
ncbi:MAG: leucine-rich repeat domain-containing protein [Opitutaceae bacterium]